MTRSKRLHRIIRTSATIAALSLGVAACGGGGGVSNASAADAVVDTCAILPAQQLSDITNSMADRDGGSTDRNYSASPEGAACIYTWDNSVVEVVIGSTGQVTSNPDADGLPLGAVIGEMTRDPWVGNGDVTTYADEWSGVTTHFGGHLESGDYGISILNIGGTVVDPSLNGDLFGEVLVAVAANLG